MPRGGSKPGERRGGRKKGTPNRVEKEVKRLAQQYTAEAVEQLAKWMRSDDPTAAVKAASVLLDRGHGKATEHKVIEKKGGHRLSYAERIAAEEKARSTAASRASDSPVGHTVQ